VNLPEAIKNAERAAADLESAVLAVGRSDPDATSPHLVIDAWESVDAILTRIRGCGETLRVALSRMKGRIPEQVVTSSGTPVAASWSKPRKTWDHARVASVVAERIVAGAVNPDTGTVDVPYGVLIQRILDFAHVDYWKIRPLKALGVNPDDYSEASETKLTLRPYRKDALRGE
jgi:hypothetical protein